MKYSVELTYKQKGRFRYSAYEALDHDILKALTWKQTVIYKNSSTSHAE